MATRWPTGKPQSKSASASKIKTSYAPRLSLLWSWLRGRTSAQRAIPAPSIERYCWLRRSSVRQMDLLVSVGDSDPPRYLAIDFQAGRFA